VRKIIEEGARNDGLIPEARQHFLKLNWEQVHITSFDLGFEMEVFGVHP